MTKRRDALVSFGHWMRTVVAFTAVLASSSCDRQALEEELQPTFFVFLDQSRASQSTIQEMLLQTLPAAQLEERREVFLAICEEVLIAQPDRSRLFSQVQSLADIPSHCSFLFDAGHEYNFVQYAALIDPTYVDVEERCNASLREALSK